MPKLVCCKHQCRCSCIVFWTCPFDALPSFSKVTVVSNFHKTCFSRRRGRLEQSKFHFPPLGAANAIDRHPMMSRGLRVPETSRHMWRGCSNHKIPRDETRAPMVISKRHNRKGKGDETGVTIVRRNGSCRMPVMSFRR